MSSQTCLQAGSHRLAVFKPSDRKVCDFPVTQKPRVTCFRQFVVGVMAPMACSTPEVHLTKASSSASATLETACKKTGLVPSQVHGRLHQAWMCRQKPAGIKASTINRWLHDRREACVKGGKHASRQGAVRGHSQVRRCSGRTASYLLLVLAGFTQLGSFSLQVCLL